MRFTPLLRVFAVAFLLCVMPFSAQAKKAEFLMRISHTGYPGIEFFEGWKKFGELVKEKTGGRIEVKIFPMGQLGADRVAMEAVQAGNLEVASCGWNVLSGVVPALAALDLPFAIDINRDVEFYRALAYEGELHDYIVELLAPAKLYPLMFNACAPRSWGFKKAGITTLADLRGLKVRATPSDVDVSCCKAAGMNPTVLSMDATFQGLQQGTIEGELLSFSTFEAQSRGGLLKSLIVTHHNIPMHVGMVSLDWWNKLPQDLKAQVTEAAKEAQEWEWSIYKGIDDRGLEYMKKHNVNITYPTEEEMANFRAMFQKVWDEYETKLDPRMLKLIRDVYK